MTAENKAAQTVEIFEAHSPPSIHELVSAWLAGMDSPEIAYIIGACNMVAPDPVAQWLYQYQCGGPDSLVRGRGLDTLTSWCHGTAAECAASSRRYRPERDLNYRRRWARQAGCDGAAMAMWGGEIRDDLPGVNKRAEQYGCRPADYLKVRNYVEVEADKLIRGFRTDIEQVFSEKPDRSLRTRFLDVTGRDYPVYA